MFEKLTFLNFLLLMLFLFSVGVKPILEEAGKPEKVIESLPMPDLKKLPKIVLRRTVHINQKKYR